MYIELAEFYLTYFVIVCKYCVGIIMCIIIHLTVE